jgi:hypothetical protein
MTDWYEVVGGPGLAQGDVLLECPVPQVEEYSIPLPDSFDVAVDYRDLVVLSQSCDLVNDKVSEVMLAAIQNYDQLVINEGATNTIIKSSRWRKAAVEGDLPAMSLLPPHAGDPAMAWSLVDFRHLFTLPKRFVTDFAEQSDNRLRIVPPYREHLAQAFARYFMRVGLPSPLHAFEKHAG